MADRPTDERRSTASITRVKCTKLTAFWCKVEQPSCYCRFTETIFGRPYYRSRLWYTVSSVCCRLSSVTFCIVAKRYVLAKNCLKERIGNRGKKLILGVAAIFLLLVSPLRPPRQPFCLIFDRTAQRSVLDGTNGLSSSKPCKYCRILRSELKPEVVLATIIDPERCE